MWALPAFSPAVPLEVSKRDSAASALARFMLLAHKKGIQLPTSNFTTTIGALAGQFAGYAKTLLKKSSAQLPLNIDICVEDGKIKLGAYAQGYLDTYCLKPVVERLNAARPGLGWFVTETIAQGHRVGLSTYDPSRVISCAELLWSGAETDEAMASELLQIEESDLTADDIEAAADEHFIMPSKLLADFGGHKNLIGWSQSPAERQATKALSATRVRASLRELCLQAEDCELLNAALKFHDLTRNMKADMRAAPEGWFQHQAEQEQYEEEIGALAFIVWDDPGLTHEIVSDYEQYGMNGEGCTTQMVGLLVDLDEPANWGTFIDAYKLYTQRYAAYSQFIGNLPRKEMSC